VIDNEIRGYILYYTGGVRVPRFCVFPPLCSRRLCFRLPVMHPRALLACLPVLLCFAIRVAAQNVQTAQCLPGWEWNQNSLGQDPCAVATILDSYCRSDPGYTYVKLNASEWYGPPSMTHEGDLACDCDTVMYSLTMACSTCQDGIAYGWDSWIPQCNTVLISDYSGNIPQGTAIPHWAFYNVTLLNNQEFDNLVAESIGRNPEALPNVPTPSVANTSKGAPHNTHAIIGGVVGAIGFLTIVAACFGCLWWRKNEERKLRRQWDGEKISPYSPTTLRHTSNVSTGPPLASNRPFHSRVPPSIPARTQNRPVTWVTPIPNGGQR